MIENVIEQCIRIRAFENEVFLRVKTGEITCPVYLCTGQELSPAYIADGIGNNYSYVLAQHRGHGVYIAFGGNLEKLRDELLGLSSGCSKGMGGSPCISDPTIRMIGHDGLIGSQIPVAGGLSYASISRGDERPVICFFGDGAAEEDYFLGSLGFISKYKLPVILVCEDNDLSVLTRKEVRRTWDLSTVAAAFGFYSFNTDDTFPINTIVSGIVEQKTYPALLNIKVYRHGWHVGAGSDGCPERDSLEELKTLYLSDKSDTFIQEWKKHETKIVEEVKDLWSQPPNR